MYSALVGMSYRIGKKNFDRNIIKYTGIDQSDWTMPTREANNLRAENEKLKEEIRKEKENEGRTCGSSDNHQDHGTGVCAL